MACVDTAVSVVRQAVLQDERRNYGEAARCYREAIDMFRRVVSTRASSPRLKDLVSSQLAQYESRLAAIARPLLAQLDVRWRLQRPFLHAHGRICPPTQGLLQHQLNKAGDDACSYGGHRGHDDRNYHTTVAF